MDHGATFSRLMDEYGNLEQEMQMGRSKASKGNNAVGHDNLNNTKVGDDLMQIEERNTGAVTWKVYSEYLKFAGGAFWAPTIFLLLVLIQAAMSYYYSSDICVQILMLGPSYK